MQYFTVVTVGTMSSGSSLYEVLCLVIVLCTEYCV